MSTTEETGPTGPTEPIEETGPTGPTEPTEISLQSLTGGTAAAPIVSLSEILSAVSVLQEQERDDQAKCSVLTPSLSDIRTKLTTWVAGGTYGTCELVRVFLTPPNVCSDGVSRNIFEYIQFVSGKSLSDHVQAFQSILPDFEVGYRCSRTDVVICVFWVKVS